VYCHLAAVVDESVHGLPDGGVRRLALLHLGLKVVLGVGPHHVVVLPPFVHRDLGFGLDHCVDSSNCSCTCQDRTALKSVSFDFFSTLNMSIIKYDEGHTVLH